MTALLIVALCLAGLFGVLILMAAAFSLGDRHGRATMRQAYDRWQDGFYENGSTVDSGSGTRWEIGVYMIKADHIAAGLWMPVPWRADHRGVMSASLDREAAHNAAIRRYIDTLDRLVGRMEADAIGAGTTP